MAEKENKKFEDGDGIHMRFCHAIPGSGGITLMNIIKYTLIVSINPTIKVHLKFAKYFIIHSKLLLDFSFTEIKQPGSNTYNQHEY